MRIRRLVLDVDKVFARPSLPGIAGPIEAVLSDQRVDLTRGLAGGNPPTRSIAAARWPVLWEARESGLV